MTVVALTPKDVENLIPNLKTVGIDDKVLAYEFTGGVYEGVVYTYAKIRFNVVDTESGESCDIDPIDVIPSDLSKSLQVAFEFVIFKNPNNKDTDTTHFKDYIGTILTTIIDAAGT